MLERGDQRMVSLQDSERAANNHPKERAVVLRNRRDEKRVDEIGRGPTFETVPALVEHGARVEEEHQPAVKSIEEAQEVTEKTIVGS